MANNPRYKYSLHKTPILGIILSQLNPIMTLAPLPVLINGKAIPAQACFGPWGFQEFEVSQIARLSAYECGRVISPINRPHLPRYSYLLEAESPQGQRLRPKGLCQRKISMAPSGIEPATFQLPAVPQPIASPHVPLPVIIFPQIFLVSLPASSLKFWNLKIYLLCSSSS